MRNLKKFLALVLAMVMAFSLMLSASATDISKFEDQDKVTDEFVESVAVLTGLNVIKGDGDEENPSIRPQDEITRAEAAALVYRIATGDIDDKQVGLYADYSNFKDVKPRTADDAGDWFAGYVGYCQNAGIIKGKSATHFDPYGKVTGYEVLAMILRAVGYGKNGEFEGSSWQVNVASYGKTKHITDSVTSALYEGELQNYTLNKNARREIVAELLFRGSLIPQVTWTQIGGYNENSTLLGTGGRNLYLSEEVFGLYPDGWKADTWGRPQYVWKAKLNPSKDRTVATLKADYTEAFHDEKRECDIAEMMEFGTDASRDYILYVNGKTAVTDKYHIVATDTVTRVGGYGRQVEIYTQEDMDKQFPWHNTLSYANNLEDEYWRLAPDDTIVMIDTYLAKVVNKTKPVLDPAGHVITPAKLIVDLYDRNDSVPFDKADSAKQPQRRTIQKPTTSKDSWDFAIGDVISLNGLSKNYAGGVGVRVGGGSDERWAYTLPTVAAPSATSDWKTALTENTNVFSLTRLEGTPGKQTTVYWNNGKHQVGGEDKTDALALRMDKAGSNIDTTYTWYYDVKDNGDSYLLGIDDGGKVNYGVITSVYAAFGTGDANTNTTGQAKAIASVLYADGNTGTEEIDYFLVSGSGLNVTTDGEPNSFGRGSAANIGQTMVESDGTAAIPNARWIQLYPIYDVAGRQPMHEAGRPYGMDPFQPTFGGDTNGNLQGVVYMAPVAASNAYAANQITDFNKSGILNNNLFKFIKSAGDKTVAIEVAGGANVDGTTNGVYDPTTTDYTKASGNNGVFSGHWAAQATGTPKLYKSLAYITKNGTSADADIVTWLDNDTQIMLRDPDTNKITTYDGVKALPGDVNISVTADNRRYYEIDWADTDSDGRADIVYLTGEVDGVTTYGLFYTNDLTAQWDGTKATIKGFLNGDETTLTFNNYDEFNKIKGATGYNAHLFAVKQVNGIVTKVMEDDFGSSLLPNDGDIVKGFKNAKGSSGRVATGIVTGSEQFEYGADSSTTKQYAGTNPYTSKTEAVYFEDYPTGTASKWSVEYQPAYNWSLVGADVIATPHNASGSPDTTNIRRFHLTPNTKIYGLGSGVVLAEGLTALEYLNHSSQINNNVTIVYENNFNTSTSEASFSVLEIYIQTDPNWTPNNPTSTVATTPGVGVSIDNSGSRAAFDTVIRAAAGGSVLYNPNYIDNSGVAGSSDTLAPDVLYFPCYIAAANTDAVLEIVDAATGTVMYREAHRFASIGGNFFVVNFAGGANIATASVNNLPLRKGATYNFTITTTAGVRLADSSFSMAS